VVAVPVIVIRLHPDKPTSGTAFSDYLVGLRIEVADRSFADPDGRLPADVLGTAFYDPADSTSTIVQHVELGPPAGPPPAPPTILAACAATAAIEIPVPVGEYLSSDLRLTVGRTVAGVTTPIIVKDINYNVDVAPGSLPAANGPAAYASLDPVAAYLALPPSLTGLPAGTGFLEVPSDGTPPPYAAVLLAMQAVVAKDPGPAAPADLAALTPAQCRHLAREIVFNRYLEPLPQPAKPLEQLYRSTGSDETARRQFEADLVTYYAVRGTRAEVLAKYIYGVSAALACRANTVAAAQAGLTVPVFPGLPGAAGQSTVSVVVTQ
jgi:hypothetical protein